MDTLKEDTDEAKNRLDAWWDHEIIDRPVICLLYTSPSPRDVEESRMPSSA